MIDPSECNCGNCAKFPCEAIVSCSETIGNNKALENVLRGVFSEFTTKTGCLSHPLAPGVLMKSVIEELEHRIADVEMARKNATQLTGGNLLVNVYKDTISLIRDGVK